MLSSKKILIGICGSIAAYKSAELIRLFIKSGAEVKVVMTQSAVEFITPLTIATLSKNPVNKDFVKNDAGEWTNHVELGLWADAFIIAPASANSIAKFANGICDNLLSAVYLSAKCPVYFAPAMDLDMWKHPSTQKNIGKLVAYGNTLIKPTHGELASGLIGEGRMAEPEDIFDFLQIQLNAEKPLLNKNILVTAGPTYEAIDPVRFIGNHSSGKMGFALAEELADQGAHVTLISGPTHLLTNHKNISIKRVTSAGEMFEQCVRYFPSVDIAIMSAAVADYTPVEVATQKIKKTENEFSLSLTKTKDILAELGKLKKPEQLLVGFALETTNEIENATGKLKKKNLDFIVLNSLNDKGAGFQGDTNKITILDKNGKTETFELKTKQEVAQDIVNKIVSTLHA
ncbi:bifunctional phosphopantothenoylcysteine decarboxylase/phosphopantothenate--cysteine ligase CoaBC [Solitalea lacus]|uniref:bifunctional phosphopantothenoylcysteine decarboxylase/phosphopantothenate--cysteine ligase CoaBC n=1 Tax=Solitalea lacus TaxID=2911172 RepID=UPI001ED9F533|nr:bifunctional phosphopantothenoylcysteine decarboxylase/phosphopantothenate--cysteine ligase CoaBC [Solitalea lacus]UKJ08492.1 bifunctional phosphopantothenoylcysteine decarboxylase/phosphopantothenate--cysteine ligase CoaBC [Solitalea lacus]